MWYFLMTWSSLLMFKYLGNFIWKKTLAKLLFDLPKSYQSHIMNYLENPILMLLVFTLSIVKLLWPLEEFFSCFMIKIHVHTIYPLAMLPWEVSIVPLLTSHKIKTPHYVIVVSLSLHPLLQKKTWAIEKNGHMKVHKKREKER